MGHYEPLRHYAEVHLLLEPGEPGSGVVARLGLPGGRARDKLAAAHTHAPGREDAPGHADRLAAHRREDHARLPAGRTRSTPRAGTSARPPTARCVRACARRQAAGGVLCCLEPWYEFTLRLPQEAVGRALADMPRLCGGVRAAGDGGRGRRSSAAARRSRSCAATRGSSRRTRTGRGQLVLPAGRLREVPQRRGGHRRGGLRRRTRTRRTRRTPCSAAHGAGFVVHWDEAPAHMHLPSVPRARAAHCPATGGARAASRAARAALPAACWPRTRSSWPSSSAPTARSGATRCRRCARRGVLRRPKPAPRPGKALPGRPGAPAGGRLQRHLRLGRACESWPTDNLDAARASG